MYESVEILSADEAEELLKGDSLKNAAVICFYNPGGRSQDYSRACSAAITVPVEDLSYDSIGTENDPAFFPQAAEAADFVRRASEEGKKIFCQCDYGQGRSAGCAAAILEYYEGKGLDIFTDYAYQPNKPIYHKLLKELRKSGGENNRAGAEASGSLLPAAVLTEKEAEPLRKRIPEKTAIINFCDAVSGPFPFGPGGRCLNVCAEDAEMEDLKMEGKTLKEYFPEADTAAAFLRQAAADGYRIFCRSDYDTDRSSACAAAVRQFFRQAGLEIFSDFRYNPSKPVYHKLMEALNRGKQHGTP